MQKVQSQTGLNSKFRTGHRYTMRSIFNKMHKVYFDPGVWNDQVKEIGQKRGAGQAHITGGGAL